MTIKKNTVRVTILGDEYTLRSGTTPEETQAVAQQVDRSIREIMQTGQVVETHKAAVMACLRMAGELMEAQRQVAHVTNGLQALNQEIRPWLPPAKRHD
jgi:cell division protein ZapA (FtsZ GTPase activity inhibitor)